LFSWPTTWTLMPLRLHSFIRRDGK